MNEQILKPLETAFKLISALPVINNKKNYRFPANYTLATLNEKLTMVRMMLQDLTDNMKTYIEEDEEFEKLD